jgi:hypothetical protein
MSDLIVDLLSKITAFYFSRPRLGGDYSGLNMRSPRASPSQMDIHILLTKGGRRKLHAHLEGRR